MRKRLMLCALLMMVSCFADPACAGAVYYINPDGGRYYHAERNCDAIAEAYRPGLVEMDADEALAMSGLGACPNCCAAETSYSRVIGGSGPDALYEVVALPDGDLLATGHTRSADGWLSDRSKTGKSGWAARIEEGGQRAWNFCSRHSNNDYMTTPVAHEDGSVTVLLRSDGSEYNQIELIRLNADGGVITRKTLMKLAQTEAHCALEWPKAFAGGYVVSRIEHTGPRVPVYTWYSFDGEVLRVSDGPKEGSLMAVGARHAIEPHDGTYWLCALDRRGHDTRLCELLDVKSGQVQYAEILSLDGGAAVVCGWRGGDACEGIITCFDAKGNVTMEMSIPDEKIEHLLPYDGGYAAVGRNRYEESSILLLDAQGRLVRRVPVKGHIARYGRPIALLEDGRLAVVSCFMGEDQGNGYANEEALLTVMDIQ
ncbi:MAG: hypothetical protein J6M47_07150 [Clostridia bacterium]|nr:hypothetical protein [Clostridia bacterium]